jgi:hypothetical protein
MGFGEILPWLIVRRKRARSRGPICCESLGWAHPAQERPTTRGPLLVAVSLLVGLSAQGR